jgi:20S proteasome alpha/beta subunit
MLLLQVQVVIYHYLLLKIVLKEDEAKQLACDALYPSITTDLYSRSKINTFVLTKDKFLLYEIAAVRDEQYMYCYCIA